MTIMLSLDRQRGTLFGRAAGDALGAAVEFEPPGTFPEVTAFRGEGAHGLAPGAWTATPAWRRPGRQCRRCSRSNLCQPVTYVFSTKVGKWYTSPNLPVRC